MACISYSHPPTRGTRRGRCGFVQAPDSSATLYLDWRSTARPFPSPGCPVPPTKRFIAAILHREPVTINVKYLIFIAQNEINVIPGHTREPNNEILAKYQTINVRRAKQAETPPRTKTQETCQRKDTLVLVCMQDEAGKHSRKEEIPFCQPKEQMTACEKSIPFAEIHTREEIQIEPSQNSAMTPTPSQCPRYHP